SWGAWYKSIWISCARTRGLLMDVSGEMKRNLRHIMKTHLACLVLCCVMGVAAASCTQQPASTDNAPIYLYPGAQQPPSSAKNPPIYPGAQQVITKDKHGS